MKTNTYRVWFNKTVTQCAVKVDAFNPKDALILATAEKIKAGANTDFSKIEILKDGEFKEITLTYKVTLN